MANREKNHSTWTRSVDQHRTRATFKITKLIITGRFKTIRDWHKVIKGPLSQARNREEVLWNGKLKTQILWWAVAYWTQ